MFPQQPLAREGVANTRSHKQLHTPYSHPPDVPQGMQSTPGPSSSLSRYQDEGISEETVFAAAIKASGLLSSASASYDNSSLLVLATARGSFAVGSSGALSRVLVPAPPGGSSGTRSYAVAQKINGGIELHVSRCKRC